MKRKISLLLVSLITASSMCVSAYADNTVTVAIDGINLDMESEPVILDGRTLVPFREVLEKMGASVNWDAGTKTVACQLDGRSVQLEIGSRTMTTSNGTVTVDVPAQIISSRTYVPLRAISEGLGVQVDWDGTTKTVIITTNKEQTDKSDTAPSAAEKSKSPLYKTESYSNSIKSGSREIVPITAEYPVFAGNGRTVTKINEYIANDAKSKTTSYKTANIKRLTALYDESLNRRKKDMFDNYGYSLSYEVKTNSDSLISVTVTEKIVSDTENKTTLSGLTFSAKTGELLSADELSDGAEAAAIEGLTDRGYEKLAIDRLKLDETSFYVEDNKLIFVINAGALAKDTVEYSIELPEEEQDVPETGVDVNTVSYSDKLTSQTNDTVMELNVTYPEFIGREEKLSALNKTIAQIQKDAAAAYKAENSSDALAAYKKFNDEKGGKNDRFEPWLWTGDFEVKYNNGELASIVTSTYVFKGDGSEDTLYSAYTCDLKTGRIIDVNSLIDLEAANSAARAAFRKLIEGDRLKFYTDVYERLDLSRASKYIDGDNVVYMFSPGVLATVSKGVIEVSVPIR